MSQIDPFSGVMPLPQRAVSERIRKSQVMTRNSTGEVADEAQVESPDSVQAIHDEQPQHPHREREEQPKKGQKEDAAKPSDGISHLDITA